MAKRRLARALSGALQGAAAGLSPWLAQMSRDQAAEKQSALIGGHQRDLDLQNRRQELQNKVLKGEITEQQAAATYAAEMGIGGGGGGQGVGGAPSFAGLGQSPDKQIEPLLNLVDTAASAEALPDDLSLTARLRAAGLDPDQSPQAQTVLRLRRKRAETFDVAGRRKMADQVQTAGDTTLATGRAQATVANETEADVLRRKAAEATTVGDIGVSQDLRKATAMVPIDARRAGAIDAATGPAEQARALELIRARAASGEGKRQTRPVLSSDANRLAEFDNAASELAAVRAVISDPTYAQLTPGPITAALGWGKEAKKRQATIARVKQVIGKTLEGGVLRTEDEKKYEKILPTLTDLRTVALAKLKGLDALIAQKRQSHLDNLDDAGFDVTQFRARQQRGTGGAGNNGKSDPGGLR